MARKKVKVAQFKMQVDLRSEEEKVAQDCNPQFQKVWLQSQTTPTPIHYNP